MKNINYIVVLAMVIFGLSSSVYAEEQLTGDQVKALFSNKTVDVEQVVKGMTFRIHTSEEGSLTILWSSGKTKDKYWHVNSEGWMCVSKKEGKKGKCGVVYSLGDGTYKKIRNGEHTHNYSNFQDGNQL